ncbi:MAG: F0F1 ATP synthase subunit A [Spirochaetaceae bacterium]|jgi:F-type H+-transporting ATPase subunit a|nr:F0F1 ATP synthase subunit A [Spirochaetaceae bacterium]
MDVSEYINEKIGGRVLCDFPMLINGKEVPFITDAVVVMWLVMAFLMIASLVLTRRLRAVPGKAQNAAESVVELIYRLCQNTIGRRWKPFAPYLGTVLLFLVCSNIAAIFNILPAGGFFEKYVRIEALNHFELEIAPPTKNFNVTACLALMTMAVVVFCEFRYKGVKGWLRSFYRPMPINGFVKALDYIARPVSLCLRLFGNMLGGFIVMNLLYFAFPFVAPSLVGMYFDFFDGALQAYVFVFLTMIFIGEACETEEEARGMPAPSRMEN